MKDVESTWKNQILGQNVDCNCFYILRIVSEFTLEEGFFFVCLKKQLRGYVKVRLKQGLPEGKE